MSNKNIIFIFGILLSGLCTYNVSAQTDTLKVMAYNVLYYGNGCQGPNGKQHNYLQTIIGYTNPDLISLEKMASIPVSPDDHSATAPVGFADSILQYALNAAFPGRYAFCPFTNNAHTNNMALVFYDVRKLGFVSLVASYTNITDFNTYKLYYKDANLGRTHDTTYLYVTPNHDKSGDEYAHVRALQIQGELNTIKQHFTRTGNHLNLGDFNVRTSEEDFYQLLTAPADTGFRFYDPPFFPDGKLTYPANWDHEGRYSAYFTTSTRESAGSFNGCGSGGGGKNWYDHIFLSGWLVSGANYMRYLPGSYRTIGNDGQRMRVAINNRNAHVNTAAPEAVIEALYRMSNKYPVMVDLLVTPNTTGTSLPDPEITGAPTVVTEQVSITNPIADKLIINFPTAMEGQEITIACIDATGTTVLTKTVTVKDDEAQIKCKLPAGEYTIKVTGKHNLILNSKVQKL